MPKLTTTASSTFSKYQILIVGILAFIQFTVVLDFMVLSPLGVILLKELNINTVQFGLVVSAYAFSAGAAGLLAAGFADKFDRKKILLFFYTGFVIGTALCAMASNYQFLLGARIFTGLFGGVISSISFAIITDLFKMETRGRVMGFVQMAFALSQVMGIPIGLLLANKFNWHAPFWMIVGISTLVGVLIIFYMKPVNEHLAFKSTKNPFQHLLKTISNPIYVKGFLGTTLLATGGFMLMPFGSTFSTNNLNLSIQSLPILYAVTGVFSMIFGPITGKLSDKIGKYNMFVVGSIISMIMVLVYTNLGPTSLWLVIAVNVILFIGVSSRMIAASALMTALPEPQDRGAFMSINSSVQQISGGIASGIAGLIVVQTTDTEPLQNHNILGYVVFISMIVAALLMYIVNKEVFKKSELA